MKKLELRSSFTQSGLFHLPSVNTPSSTLLEYDNFHAVFQNINYFFANVYRKPQALSVQPMDITVPQVLDQHVQHASVRHRRDREN